MTRPLRIEFEGALYHITSRGNAKEAIFFTEKDFADFLEVLVQVVKRYNWLLHAYCLMNNHYHLLVETPEGNLSRGMRQLNGVYTQRFNRRHKRVGHLFQGRYKAFLIEKESYLLELSRYIVLNPVRAKLVKNPGEWRQSSYRATAGIEKPNCSFTPDWIIAQFGNQKGKAFEKYQRFVQEGLGKESPLSKVQGQLFLGRNNFIEQLKPLLANKEKVMEIPRSQRHATRPTLDQLLSKAKTIRMVSPVKDKALCEAHILYEYTLQELADYLGVHYATISRAVKRAAEKEKYDCKT
ncbi:MAG TPA: addiction module toxin RelE [Actinobacteria bacterium]|nr:addiction module toxin RelE [Actinomycetota bacterium]